MSHPADAASWKLVDEKWPSFGADPRNLILALSTDGFNTFSGQISKYSCWPVILLIYNLPPWLVMKRKHMMLTLLISGPKQPGNNIDVYLQPLIDDLNRLWEGGAFVIGNESKIVVMQSVVARWREFKSRLTKELRKTQQACRRMNKYPQRLSHKGYVGLVAELKAKAMPAQVEPEEASTISDEDELYDRCEIWVAACVTKESKFAGEETQKKDEEIIELKEKVSTGETSLSGYNDVLEKALGNEHGGKV
ncbi:hypothetical protein ACLB2K_037893 [Fragaria x ananassa]